MHRILIAISLTLLALLPAKADEVDFSKRVGDLIWNTEIVSKMEKRPLTAKQMLEACMQAQTLIEEARGLGLEKKPIVLPLFGLRRLYNCPAEQHATLPAHLAGSF